MKIKKRKRLFAIIFVFVLLLSIVSMYFLQKNERAGSYLTYSTERCMCEPDTKHTHFDLMFSFDKQNNTIHVEFNCPNCQTTVATTEVTSYPANMMVRISSFIGNEQSLSYVSLSQYTGSEPRIFDEIKVLSKSNNVTNIVYEDSKQSYLISDLYKFSDWTKDIIDLLGEYHSNDFSISFDPNGGTGIMESTLLTSGTLPSCTYMKDGYLFCGWALNKDEEPLYYDKEDITINKNTTLYACWIKNPYNIQVKTEDESRGIAKINSLFNREMTISATNCNGFSFKGWYEDDKLVSVDSTYVFDLPERDFTYTAKFDSHQNIVKIIDGGDGYSGDIENAIPGEDINVYAGTRPGYEFGEWNVTRGDVKLTDLNTPNTSFIMTEDDIVLTAVWKEINGISATLNNTFKAMYNSPTYYNDVAYDIDQGITIKDNMVSVFVDYTNGTKRQVETFSMAPLTLNNIGGNHLPITLVLDGIQYSTEIIVQGYSSSLYKLMMAAGLDADAFQRLTILISSIQSSLVNIQNNLNMYSRQIDQFVVSINTKSKDKTALAAESKTIHNSLEAQTKLLVDIESQISSVTQQARMLISTYQNVNNQAIADAFEALAVQIKNLTDQVLNTTDKQSLIINKYESANNKIK